MLAVKKGRNFALIIEPDDDGGKTILARLNGENHYETAILFATAPAMLEYLKELQLLSLDFADHHRIKDLVARAEGHPNN